MRTELRKILAVVMVLALTVSMFAFSVSADDTTVGDFIVATQDEVATDDEVATKDEVATEDEVATDDEVATEDEIATEDEPVYGDADLNGKVDVRDATLIQKAVADLATLDELQAAVANVIVADTLNVKDATEIQKWVADLSDNALIGTTYVPTETPDEPVTTPDEPVVTPDEPVVTPDEPVTTPDEPVTTPDEPVTTPDEPVITPDEPVTTPDEPIVVETVTIIFYTAKTGWVTDYDAYMTLVDTDTDESYVMSLDAETNSWFAVVPATVQNIRFDRCDPATGNAWNSWEAADRGDTLVYQTTDSGVGEWNDEIAAIEDIIIAFDNTEAQWDFVAFYQWSDSAFASYTVMTQLEGTDYWYITINTNITTGLFKGTADGEWADVFQTENIVVDVETYGNVILFTPVSTGGKWGTTPSTVTLP